MTQSYEELSGALGRAASYRPRRYKVKELVRDPGWLHLTVNGSECRLADISLNGVAFWHTSDWEGGVGDPADFSVHLGKEPLLQGRGIISRVDAEAQRLKVAVAVDGGIVDFAALQRAEEEHRFSSALRRGARPLETVPTEYRKALGDIVAFCQHYRSLLAVRERQIAGGAGAASPAETRLLAADAFETMHSDWQTLSEAAAQASLEFLRDRKTLEKARDLTELTATPFLTEAPVLERAYRKPLGYAGDYKVMEYYFDNDFRGQSAFGQVFHKITCEHPLSAGVRTRTRFVADAIAALHGRTNTERPMRVVSFGCGPAHELGMAEESLADSPRPIEWSLVDQEDDALTAAYTAAREVCVGRSRKSSARCYNVSFVSLLKGSANILHGLGGQDFVVSTGLFDYIGTQSASRLVAALFAMLEPGGVLAIGNAKAPNLNFWEPELALDWPILYRTEGEVEELASQLPQSAQVQIRAEPIGAYLFLMCTKQE